MPTENIRRTEVSLLNAPVSDLYVLPEMWSTGFGSPQSLTESGFDYGSDMSLQWMKTMSIRLDAAIAGSLSVRERDGIYRNRFYFVTPDDVWYYDKRHLFSYGSEHLAYTAGKERIVVEWRGVRFLLQICYDLRFPCFSRNWIIRSDEPLPSYGYDCALYVASWPTSRISVWHALLRARALENQCYVVGVNRIGEDPQCTYCGGTCAIDAYGRTVASCPEGTIASCSFEMDLEGLARFHRKFPVLEDV